MARSLHDSNRLLRQSEPNADGDRLRPPSRLIPSQKAVLTVAGLLLTAWFLPALSHQWQDRQRALSGAPPWRSPDPYRALRKTGPPVTETRLARPKRISNLRGGDRDGNQ